MDVRALDNCEAFSSLSDEERADILALADELELAAGERVFEEGSEGESLYVVLTGGIALRRSGHVVVQLGPGDFFGEMSLFNRYVRVAEALATEPATVLELRRRDLQPLVLRQDPAALKLVQRLGSLTVERLQRLGGSRGEPLVDDPALIALEEYRQLKERLLAGWALAYHAIGKPGKLGIQSTKPAATAADLSVAYSPGVAEPSLAIRDDQTAAYAYTGKGHLVGVISNGTAVLGLGSIGAAAAKPVMEGKAVLFKRFADLDAFDLEIEETDPQRFVDIVCSLAPTFGGINLEDIRAPECFFIERECQRRLGIPVMHDDQHGTAIVAGAALLNALELVGKDIGSVRVVFSGAGAAGFATAKFLLALGVGREHLVLTDARGVVYAGRGDGNYLEELAADTDARTLAEVVAGADVFVGVSVGDILTPAMLRSMASRPIVFALANPRPEIDPMLARKTSPDVVLATGRSDYPNQVNNLLAFPYLFRGALDVRASMINEEMKLAAARAIAELARQPINADAGFDGAGLTFGPAYLIPKPFDRRLLPEVGAGVAGAALRTGVAAVGLPLGEYCEDLRRLALSL
ncbi:MAG TPA: cyclic nucleotide-binding domain-containing protein [Actinomycetota bacterium]|nr:cyclic nucleotide-binding domain-containing protein [Actinomycetota bacterium]